MKVMCILRRSTARLFADSLWLEQERPARGKIRAIQCPDECPQAVADLIEACIAQDHTQRPTATGDVCGCLCSGIRVSWVDAGICTGTAAMLPRTVHREN